MDTLAMASAAHGLLHAAQLMLSTLNRLILLDAGANSPGLQCLESVVAELETSLEVSRRLCYSETTSKTKLTASLDELKSMLKGVQAQLAVNVQQSRSPSPTSLSNTPNAGTRGDYADGIEGLNIACLEKCKNRAEQSSKSENIDTLKIPSVRQLRPSDLIVASITQPTASNNKATSQHCRTMTSERWPNWRSRIIRWLTKGFILLFSPLPITVLANYPRTRHVVEIEPISMSSGLPWVAGHDYGDSQSFVDPMLSIRPSAHEVYNHAKSLTQVLGTVKEPLPIVFIVAAMGLSGLLGWYHRLNRRDTYQNTILWGGLGLSWAWGLYSSPNMLVLLLERMPLVALMLLTLSDILHTLAGVWHHYHPVDVEARCISHACAYSPHIDVEANWIREKAIAGRSHN